MSKKYQVNSALYDEYITPCNHSKPMPMLWHKTKVTAGNANSCKYRKEVLNLDLAYNYAPPLRGFNLKKEIKLPEYPCIQVDWTDGYIPTLTRKDWVNLAKTIYLYKWVHIACIGGHGRTGTALAILHSFSGNIPKKMSPLVWVRKNYCDRAIESESQARYIEMITGRKTPYIVRKGAYERVHRAGYNTSRGSYANSEYGFTSDVE